MKQVLIVDDAPFVRLTLKNMLEKNGFLIAGEATNGQEAIIKYFQLKPDVVTMDISMPVMNGTTALKQIINKDPQANVIMVTAVGQEEFIKEAVLNGAKYFIVKPLEEEFVVNTINRILTC